MSYFWSKNKRWNISTDGDLIPDWKHIRINLPFNISIFSTWQKWEIDFEFLWFRLTVAYYKKKKNEPETPL